MPLVFYLGWVQSWSWEQLRVVVVWTRAGSCLWRCSLFLACWMAQGCSAQFHNCQHGITLLN